MRGKQSSCLHCFLHARTHASTQQPGPIASSTPGTSGPTSPSSAHRPQHSLPFGSLVRVTSSRTGKSVVVRINDRGPFHGNRVIDLSEAAASEIGLKTRGSGTVQMALLDG